MVFVDNRLDAKYITTTTTKLSPNKRLECVSLVKMIFLNIHIEGALNGLNYSYDCLTDWSFTTFLKVVRMILLKSCILINPVECLKDLGLLF